MSSVRHWANSTEWKTNMWKNWYFYWGQNPKLDIFGSGCIHIIKLAPRLDSVPPKTYSKMYHTYIFIL